MSNEPTPELLPCPFCGSTDIDFFYGESFIFPSCHSCFAMGPNCPQELSAAEAWNRRVTAKKKP